MLKRIKRVAVLGSGVMGSGIACHLANIGLDVLLLDILPSDNPSNGRNKIADTALANAIKSKPAPLYDVAFSKQIQTGNFTDDMPKIKDVDWIVEVVVERLDIKQQIFSLVDTYMTPGTYITSNTSGIPISMLAAGRSDAFRKNFCGTHFFNPARYMALLEIIPHSETDPEVVDFWMDYGDRFIGKQTVLCKDTPAFIANRIGFYSGNRVAELTETYNLTIEDVDKLTGDTIGWPNTGSYRLLDLVGIDTSVKVTKGVIDNCPNDEYVKKIKDKPIQKALQFLLDSNFLGDKSGQGFYKKTDQRDEKGGRVILSLDLHTLAYRPAIKNQLAAIGIAKKVEIMDKRIKDILALDDPSCHFVRDLLTGIISYAANRYSEITDTIYSIDHAMKAGYAWGYGPFEYWDMLGIKAGAELGRSLGENFPSWVDTIIADGIDTFYKVENGIKKCYDIPSKSYKAIPGADKKIHLDNLRTNAPVYKNTECIIHDIGHDVLCIEFISKSNAIGEGIGEGVVEALNLAQNGNWRGIVIGNNAKNFTVGANLFNVAMVAIQKDWAKLEYMVNAFQQINMSMRYANVPIITATQGYVFGGGCEMLMHTDGAVCHAESYIGLVEVGVGLIPGGGGTKEFAIRASESFFDGDVQIPTIIEKLKVISTATVSTSGYEGYTHGYLQHGRDDVEVNLSRVISRAKNKVIAMSDKYTAPSPKMANVLGRNALGAMYTALNEFYLGKFMSEYDLEIGRKVAYVLCGGDLTSHQLVSEQYLLDIEREAFLQLLGNQKTIDRIQYTLMNNKPLRN